MTAGHTEGPWEVWPSLYEGMKASVVYAPLGGPLKTVAEVRGTFRDAQTLAASLDMLEALRAVANYFWDAEGPGPLSEGEVESLLRDAVAKAEGRRA